MDDSTISWRAASIEGREDATERNEGRLGDASSTRDAFELGVEVSDAGCRHPPHDQPQQPSCGQSRCRPPRARRPYRIRTLP